MKKIPNVFKRDFDGDREIFDEYHEDCLWVRDGEGIATRKWDGTACMVRDTILYKRYDAKNGKTPPANWEPCQPGPDPKTGHWPGWVPVGSEPENWMHREAFAVLLDGTYELIGPKVNGNPEGADRHILIQHGRSSMLAPAFSPLALTTRTFGGLRDALDGCGMEGIVFWHPDGRRAKIRCRDFGVSR